MFTQGLDNHKSGATLDESDLAYPDEESDSEEHGRKDAVAEGHEGEDSSDHDNVDGNEDSGEETESYNGDDDVDQS